jgi:ribosomal protein S18 acetylase RimI-like enzyme
MTLRPATPADVPAPALLTEAVRLVAAAGHPRAWLAVAAGNTRARRFYERSGWIDEGPFEYAAPDSGVRLTCHRYTIDCRLYAPLTE